MFQLLSNYEDINIKDSAPTILLQNSWLKKECAESCCAIFCQIPHRFVNTEFNDTTFKRSNTQSSQVFIEVEHAKLK